MEGAAAVAVVAVVLTGAIDFVTSRPSRSGPASVATSSAEVSDGAGRGPVGPRVTSSSRVNDIVGALRREVGSPVGQFGDARLLALADLARLGPQSATAVAELLEDGDPQVRALAGEALGFLGDPSVSAALEGVVATDPDPQARLYAVRSLGQLGTIRPTPAILKALHEDDSHDVRAHVEMALHGRTGRGGDDVRAALAAFTPEQMDSAAVDRLAPISGFATWAERSTRWPSTGGKSPVILVFLVGDVCPYCPGQISQLRAGSSKIEELGATLLMVESHESFRLHATLKKATAGPAGDFPILADPAATVGAAYGVAMQARAHTEWSGRPASFVIDRGGVVRFIQRDTQDTRVNPEVLMQVVRLVNHLDGLHEGTGDSPGWVGHAEAGL